MTNGIQEGGIVPKDSVYSYQIYNQLNNEINAFNSLPKYDKMLCSTCKNIELVNYSTNLNTSEQIWLCPSCRQITYVNKLISFSFPNYPNTLSASQNYYINTTNTTSSTPLPNRIIMPDEINQPVEIPIECPICNDLFSNHKEYDEHIEKEHKWMIGGTVHEDEEETR